MNPRRKLTSEEKQKAIELYISGLGYWLIAKQLNRPLTTIARWIKKNGLGRPRKILSSECRKEIIRLYKSGLNMQKVAEKFDISDMAVLKIIKKLGISRKGGLAKEKHWNWKGGITPKNTFERNLPEYKEWRMKVYWRDRWACQQCGKVGQQLHAHHILSWTQYPTRRFDINNGITLCRDCHMKLHGLNKKFA